MKRIAKLLFSLIFLMAASSQAQVKAPVEAVVDRFMRYVKIDTQSMEDQKTVPSTRRQLDLANLLAKELRALGVSNVRVSPYGIVYAMLPGNLPDKKGSEILGLIAHMDTSPEVSGTGVKPTIHRNYRGGDIILPGDPTQVIKVARNPVLKEMIGDDIITSDGTTLLGSDDKAGVAAIMTLVDTLRQNPQILHGPIALAFTPDEEVGGGIDKFDIAGFRAQSAFTVDGGDLGDITNETWNARTALLSFHGINTHPGSAKGVLVNSAFALADLLKQLPADMLPESTEGRQGFLHPYSGSLEVGQSTLKILLRDFDAAGIDAKESLLRKIVDQTRQTFPTVQITMEVKNEYRNMRTVLDNYPRLIERAMDATRRAGLTPKLEASRGGTDGAELTFRGLPCPDIFTGGHNFHSKLEFNSRRGLEKTTETLLHLISIGAGPR